MADLSGRTLGQYTVVRPIGEGGMATVYLARQESPAREVAIKVLSTELAGDAEFITRFRREAQTVALLQHPHILPVYDSGEEGRNVYLVMRLMTGGTLADEMDKGPVSLNRARWLIGQIASALTYAHNRGVVHRDLKPENILLDEQGNAYLTDFGIAKMLGGAEHLTRTGHLLGTPSYMAPEQWRARPVDARTDIYALGIVLYEMLVGVHAFEADTPYELMYEHLDKQPPSPVRYHPELPSTVETVIFKAIAKLPEDRYASAQEMSDALIQVVARAPNPDHHPSRPARRFPTIVNGTQFNYDESTHELPRAQIEELPDWAKRLAGAPPTPGSDSTLPPIRVAPSRKPTAPPQAPPTAPPRKTAAPATASPPPRRTAAPAAASPPVSPPRVPKPSDVQPTAPSDRFRGRLGGRRTLLAALGLIVVAGVVLLVVLLASQGDKHKAASTGTATAVVPGPTATPSLEPTATAPAATPTEMPTPTVTLPVFTILSTATPIPPPASDTPLPEASSTPVAFMIPPSSTPGQPQAVAQVSTPTSIPDLLPATSPPTLDLQATADVLVRERLTQTASAWTVTPAPTLTPQPSNTPAPSVTPVPPPSNTPTPLPTATPLPPPTLPPVTVAVLALAPTQPPTPTAVDLPANTAAPPPVALECDVTPSSGTAVNIRGGPGRGFRVVAQLQPGSAARMRMRTDTGFIYVNSGWIDDQYVTFIPEAACAALPLISAQDSSAAAVCRVSAVQSPSDLRTGPDPGADRVYLVRSGTALNVFRVVTGSDGQPWYYAATNDRAWHFGWMPASQAQASTACPPPETL